MIRISRHGYRTLATSAVFMGAAAAALYLYVHPAAAAAPPMVFVLLALFFRDPERVAPRGEHLALSPADGTVADIEHVDEGEFLHERAIRIGIFLSVFSVHVNRAPVAGVVKHLNYRTGKKLAAFRAKAATVNESNSIGLESTHSPDHGAPVRVLVKQIAGAIARRIVCSCNEADYLARGQRIGMIKFGSRTELYVPSAAVADLRVKIGDRVSGGSTVFFCALRSGAGVLPGAE